MPIYAYKCESCGFAKDVLQKMSDAPLEVCPSCAQATFKKQVTAAGFQLKGSGWYVTDFKGGGGSTTSAASPAGTTGSGDSNAAAPKADAAPATSSTPPAASGS
jgi:putative FmdB family regulatory protein